MTSIITHKLLIDECVRILNCTRESLDIFLRHPIRRAMLLSKIGGRKVRTTYENGKPGEFRVFAIGGITKKGADMVPAHGNPNLSVAAHFYAWRGIRLRRPHLPCIIESHPGSGEAYHPMELLELVEDENEHATVQMEMERVNFKRKIINFLSSRSRSHQNPSLAGWIEF